VNEVAEKVGFNDYYYFTKVFKKMIGETPSSFRDTKQQAHLTQKLNGDS
jgi:two-component system response regulator YesN